MKTNFFKREHLMSLGLLALMCLSGGDLYAMAQPAAGDPFYGVYDFLYNGAYSGPLGWVTALGGGTVATLQVMGGKWKEALMAGGGIGVFGNLGNLITSVGITVL